MLGKRVLTAVLGVPLAVYVINYGQWLFFVMILLLALIAWKEFSAMLKRKQIPVSHYIGIIGIVFLLGCAWQGNVQEFTMIITAVILSVMARVVFGSGSFTIASAAYTIMGFLYIGLPFSHFLMLRILDQNQQIATFFGFIPQGAAYLWLPFIGTWASDTFGYFVGTFLGKHKLCPVISPAKTVEGAAGGLIGSICGVICIGLLFHLPLFHLFIVGVLVGIAAPAGDLVESALKRFTGVKDSGRLLPGHGGVLDRFDSVMFAVPVVYYYIYFNVLL
ncbi:MAG: Cytidylyltransferase family protein [Firmicutes bacterium]|nr:Cytidylyltransferase family protein [Bacillota bacterium]